MPVRVMSRFSRSHIHCLLCVQALAWLLPSAAALAQTQKPPQELPQEPSQRQASQQTDPSPQVSAKQEAGQNASNASAKPRQESFIGFDAVQLIDPSGKTSASMAAARMRGQDCFASLMFGVRPVSRDASLNLKSICLENQSVGYSPRALSPVWAAERITTRNLADAGRYRNFTHAPWHAEAALRDNGMTAVEPSLYADGGKWAPAPLADPVNMPTKRSAWQAYSMMNVAPMNPVLAQDLWLRIRQAVTSLAINPRTLQYSPTHISMWVVTGACFPTIPKDAPDTARIPDYFFKALYSEEHKINGAFLVPNDASGKYHIISFGNLSRVCRIDPFPMASDDKKQTVSNMPAPSDQVKTNGVFIRGIYRQDSQ